MLYYCKKLLFTDTYNFTDNLYMDFLENDYIKVGTSENGASICSFCIKELKRNIVLSLKSEEEYLTSTTYSCSIIGMYAGRVENAVLQIDNQVYQLDKNEGKHSLHGGVAGLSHKRWKKIQQSEKSITYQTSVKALEDGLPGERCITCTYQLEDRKIKILLKAESSEKTHINLTNHLYLNLSGEKTITNHLLTIPSSKVYLNNEEHIIEDEFTTSETTLDFNIGRKIGNTAIKLNNPYILTDNYALLETKDLQVRVSSNAKALVVYGGFYLPTPCSHIALEFQDIPINSRMDETEYFTGKMFNRYIEIEVKEPLHKAKAP